MSQLNDLIITHIRATVKVAPTYMSDIQAFVGATFTVALTSRSPLLHSRPYFTVALTSRSPYFTVALT